jgi:hypothetical protein
LMTTGYEHYLTLAADWLCLLAVNRKAEIVSMIVTGTEASRDFRRSKRSVSTSYPSSSLMSLLTLSPGFPWDDAHYPPLLH